MMRRAPSGKALNQSLELTSEGSSVQARFNIGSGSISSSSTKVQLFPQNSRGGPAAVKPCAFLPLACLSACHPFAAAPSSAARRDRTAGGCEKRADRPRLAPPPASRHSPSGAATSWPCGVIRDLAMAAWRREGGRRRKP
uniref:Uncharacterized protein n=1 Tax=Arundo donax TaxID=35708 RepID=A0A0A9BRB2_ARUDO